MRNIYQNELTHPAFKDKRFTDYLSYLLNRLANKRSFSSYSINEMIELLRPDKIIDNVNSHLRLLDNRVNINDTMAVIDLIYSQFIKGKVDDMLFDWINETNPRACLFAWRRIHYISFEEYSSTIPGDPSKYVRWHFTGMPYTVGKMLNDLDASILTSKLFDIKTSIIRYFDRLEINKEGKSNLLLNIQHRYLSASTNKTIHSWFNKKNIEQIDWTINYMRTTLLYCPLVSHETSQSGRIIQDDIQSFFDILFDENKDKYKYALSAMKKAWSQKKFRDENTSKKQFSINMSKDITFILNELVSTNGDRINKNELIESLIRKEYELMKVKHKV